MIWILIVCTAGLGSLCGQLITYEYHSEKSCYVALNEMKSQGVEKFKYLICSPKQEKNK